MEAFILLSFLGLLVVALKGVGSGKSPPPTASRSRGDKVGASSQPMVAESFKNSEGQIYDFLMRLRQLDDQSIGLVLVTASHEFQRLAKMSPDSDLWFKELHPRHIGDLSNLETALQLRISAFQANGELSQTPRLMVMLHTIRGIIDPRATMPAIEMWTEINKRGGKHIDYGVRAAAELCGLDFSDFSRYEAANFMPLALFEKAKNL